MLGHKNNDPKSISDFNSRWADRIALLILAGLAVEIAEVLIMGREWPEWALSIAATSLIALGVWSELWFAKRARTADDSRVAQAEKALAEAIEGAAKLEKEAADARGRVADIERLTAWRRVSDEQAEQIAVSLRHMEGEIDLWVEYERTDPES